MSPVPSRLSVTTRSGRVTVVCGAADAVRVEGGRLETQADGSVRVEALGADSDRVKVRCPEGTDLVVGTSNGRVQVYGPAGIVHISTANGRVEVERAASVDVRTSSGRITVGCCDDDCRAVTQSGRITVGAAGRVDLSAVSGRVEVGEAGGATVRTVSGSVEIGARVGALVDVHSVSGRVEVEVPAGVAPAAVLESASGRVSCDCPIGTDGRVEVHTTSGSIRISAR